MTQMVLPRHKGNFGIIAAVVATIALAATTATIFGIAISQSVATASTVDTLAAKVATTLNTQN